jgi:hypothetical protein
MWLRPRRDLRFGELLAALAAHVQDGAQALAQALDADPRGRVEASARLQEVDQQAEATLHAVLRGLSSAFVTPFERADVFRVAWAMRVCVARMDAAADEIVLFEVPDLPAAAAEVVGLVGRAGELAAVAVPRLGRPGALQEPWIELTRLGKQGGPAVRRFLVEATGRDVAQDASRLVRVAVIATSLHAVLAAFEDLAHALQTVAVKEG